MRPVLVLEPHRRIAVHRARCSVVGQPQGECVLPGRLADTRSERGRELPHETPALRPYLRPGVAIGPSGDDRRDEERAAERQRDPDARRRSAGRRDQKRACLRTSAIGERVVVGAEDVERRHAARLNHHGVEWLRGRAALDDADRRRTKRRPPREAAGVRAHIRERERLDELTARLSVGGRLNMQLGGRARWRRRGEREDERHHRGHESNSTGWPRSRRSAAAGAPDWRRRRRC